MNIVHLGNIITEWNQQVDWSEITTLHGRYECEAQTPGNAFGFPGQTGFMHQRPNTKHDPFTAYRAVDELAQEQWVFEANA